ncbi:MAG: hypothetical protein H6Q71_1318 [Firmicutes bacterium]|nr:hypothetical protein [Bacillota bacterium]
MVNLQTLGIENIDISRIVIVIGDYVKENSDEALKSGTYIEEDVFDELIKKMDSTLQHPEEKSITILGMTIPTTKVEAMATIISKAAEIASTKSKYVKYRNSLEIGLLIWTYHSLA